MNSGFELTPLATQDLDDIWWFIAKDSPEAANRVEAEIVSTFRRLAKHPLIGTRRRDITHLLVRFWTLPKFPNYVIVYSPDKTPLQVIAVLHGRRDPKKALQGRLSQ
jgi:plasmid stabilization system protein ParE